MGRLQAGEVTYGRAGRSVSSHRYASRFSTATTPSTVRVNCTAIGTSDPRSSFPVSVPTRSWTSAWTVNGSADVGPKGPRVAGPRHLTGTRQEHDTGCVMAPYRENGWRLVVRWEQCRCTPTAARSAVSGSRSASRSLRGECGWSLTVPHAGAVRCGRSRRCAPLSIPPHGPGDGHRVVRRPRMRRTVRGDRSAP